MKQNGLKVKEIKFVALLKDHSKSKARKDLEYPQKPVVVHTVQVTEEALKDIEAFINLKVRQFEVAETLVDEKLTPCRSFYVKLAQKIRIRYQKFKTKEKKYERNFKTPLVRKGRRP